MENQTKADPIVLFYVNGEERHVALSELDPRAITRDLVAAGIKLLDERIPGWEKSIDLEDLELSSSSECILGQLFDHSYGDGLNRLDIRGEPYGFADYESFVTDRWVDLSTYDLLQEEWVSALEKRPTTGTEIGWFDPDDWDGPESEDDEDN